MTPLDRKEHDWEKELSSRPFPAKGMDESLRRRVEEQLDRRQECRRRWFWPVTGGVAVTLAFAAAWLSLPYLGNLIPSKPSPTAAALLQTAKSEKLAAGTPPAEVAVPPVKTGVLIGLRQDNPQTDEASTYRTVMLAPVNGEVTVAAEGKGILVPYGQKFWKIDTMSYQSPNDNIHYLVAYQADLPAPQAASEAVKAVNSSARQADEQVLHTEKLLYAGNQYVSVAEEEATSRGNITAASTQVWVRKLNQMTAYPGLSAKYSPQPAYESQGHITLQDIYGAGARDILDQMKRTYDSLASVGESSNLSPAVKPGSGGQLDGDNWAIIRQPGRWIAQVAEVNRSKTEQRESYKLFNYPEDLPEAVTTHDKVYSTWGEVKSLQPKATDLLSSPLEDMLVVWTDDEMVVYSPAEPASASKALLHVPLRDGEQLVSAQWATGSYVGEWVTKTRKYLTAAQEGR